MSRQAVPQHRRKTLGYSASGAKCNRDGALSVDKNTYFEIFACALGKASINLVDGKPLVGLL
jgi:hypothetical protein